MTAGWVTNLELRQPAGTSHEVAFANALDVAQRLMAEGWDVTIKPTLPDEPIGSAWFNADTPEDDNA